jgi:hypothetical protein
VWNAEICSSIDFARPAENLQVNFGGKEEFVVNSDLDYHSSGYRKARLAHSEAWLHPQRRGNISVSCSLRPNPAVRGISRLKEKNAMRTVYCRSM